MMELPEYQNTVTLLRLLKGDAAEIQDKLQGVLANLSSLTHPLHPFLKRLEQGLRYFSDYVDTTLDCKVQKAVEQCPPEDLQNEYQELYYDLTVCKPSAFYAEVESFIRKCRQVLERELHCLDQYMRTQMPGADMANLKSRSAKLHRQVVHAKETQERFDAAESRDPPDVELLLRIVLVIHRNLKMFRFKMTRAAAAKSQLEVYLGRELVTKEHFVTVPESPNLGVDERGRKTARSERLRVWSPSAAETTNKTAGRRRVAPT